MNNAYNWTYDELLKEKLANVKRSEEKSALGGGIFIIMILVISLRVILLILDYVLSRRVGEIGKVPKVPFSLEKFTKYENSDGVRFYLGYNKSNENRAPNSKSVCEKMDRILNSFGSGLVPSNARVISIKMNGFQHGEDCHDFEPIDGAVPGSCYTYQMFGGSRFQVTFYVEDEVSYVAGFCIYIHDENEYAFTYREQFIREILKYPKFPKSSQLPVRTRRQKNPTRRQLEPRINVQSRRIMNEISLPNTIPTEKWNVKFCRKLRRDVMTTSINESVYHKEWNQVMDKMTSHPCINCSRRLDRDLPPTYSSLSIV